MFKNHGMTDKFVSDKDPKFTSKFWKLHIVLCGVNLKMLRIRHLQTDGASKTTDLSEHIYSK